MVISLRCSIAYVYNTTTRPIQSLINKYIMLTLSDISYNYSKGRDALHGITTEAGSGFYLLIGENGSGKTTLLHIMAGLRYPTCGTCELDGIPIRLRRPSELCRIQYLGDDMAFPARSIKEMADTHARFFPHFDSEMLAHNLDAFGISYKDRLENMSLGIRHKAHLAYMLALKCDILLLDEPTNGLDISSKQAFNRMLVECVSPEQSVIVSTHTPADLESLYDNVMVLNHGELLININVDEISERIAFVTQSTQTPDALYCETRFGLHRCIVSNTDRKIESQLDFGLLYNALSGPSRQAILNCLNS